MSNLEKMTGHTRLYRRNATYYHRASVPADITDTYGKVEETISLRTKDYSDALRLVKIKAVEVDERFEAHRRELTLTAQPYLKELTEEQVKRFGEVYYAYLLEEDDESRLEGFDEFEDIDGERVWVGERSKTPRSTFEEHTDGIEFMLEGAKHDLARGKVDEFTKSETEEVLSWVGLELKLVKGSPSWPLLYRELNRSIKRASEVRLNRNEGNVVETPKVDSASQVQAPSASRLPLLSTAIGQWVSNMEYNWSLKTKKGNVRWVQDFLEICGDRALDDYSKIDGRLFKETFERLPRGWRIRDDLKNLHINKAALKANKLNLKPMARDNINKGVGKVSLFWVWADAQYFDDNAPQPLKGLKYKIKKNPRGERNPFSTEQLTKIFTSPIFTGCKSETHWALTGTEVLKKSPKYWVPMIALFTGARLGEICQLEVDDIKTEKGIPYFNIDGALASERLDGEKGIKTLNARRKIPVHPILLETGFLNYFQHIKTTKQKRLFPLLKSGADGSYSDHFSKHFGRHLVACDAKTSKTSFHSFRHNFEDACGNAKITGDVRDTLQGHSSGGMRARYGSRNIELEILHKEIIRIEYPDLDLLHLK